MPARSFLDCHVFEDGVQADSVEDTPMGPADYSNSLGQQDVVISGISCRLPESDNMAEYRDNLINGVDMVTDDSRRWKPGIYKSYAFLVC